MLVNTGELFPAFSTDFAFPGNFILYVVRYSIPANYPANHLTHLSHFNILNYVQTLSFNGNLLTTTSLQSFL